MNNKQTKYYQLVLVWVHDSAKYQEYLQKLAPIVTKYGGAAERIFQPTTIWAEELPLPNAVNFVHYDSKEAFAAFKADPAFQQIVHLRGESISMLAVEGELAFSQPSTDGLAERLYNIEFAYYKAGSPAAYQHYEAVGEAKMREYGFAVEYVLAVAGEQASARQPDIAKISYFKSAADRANFERDPFHKTIEEELYPAAIDKVIWITGRIYPH